MRTKTGPPLGYSERVRLLIAAEEARERRIDRVVQAWYRKGFDQLRAKQRAALERADTIRSGHEQGGFDDADAQLLIHAAEEAAAHWGRQLAELELEVVLYTHRVRAVRTLVADDCLREMARALFEEMYR